MHEVKMIINLNSLKFKKEGIECTSVQYVLEIEEIREVFEIPKKEETFH